MKIIALILAVFVAFPNLGYSLTSSCCTHEKVESVDCADDMADTKDISQEDHEPCPSQCDCSCCHVTFLIKDKLESAGTFNTKFIKSNPLNQGTTFAIGYIGHVWQPPKLS